MTGDARYDEFESGLEPLWLRAQSGDKDACRESLLRRAGWLRGYLRRRLQA